MPAIYVIAGPNGIGKTTSSFDILPANTLVISSHEIAKEARAPEAGTLEDCPTRKTLQKICAVK